MRFLTELVHAGEPRPRIQGAIALPIFQTSTFEVSSNAPYHDVKYARLSNTPNHEALAKKLAVLEATEAALVTGSGMAAVSTALLSVLKSGDHLIAHDCLYGGTYGLVARDLRELGIETTFTRAGDRAALAQALRPTTRAVYVEALTNPLLEIVDLEAVVAFAREHGLVSLIDATMASPVNLRPATHGFDLVIHSATKYLNGHSDIVAGVIAGSLERVAAAKRKLDHFGGSLDPHACFLLQRGLKTLGVRVERQNRTALALAEHLAGETRVAAVHYPGLATDPSHARARAWFHGGGGMLSFRPRGGTAAAERFCGAVRIATNAPSFGGPESLVTRPAVTSHAGLTPEERARLGVTDDLVRISVGLEDVEDLIEDFSQALG